LDFRKKFRKEGAELIFSRGLPEYEPREFASEFLLIASKNLEEKLFDILVGFHTEDIQFIQDDRIKNLVVTCLGAIMEAADITRRGTRWSLTLTWARMVKGILEGGGSVN
jgi:hypothetical protein